MAALRPFALYFYAVHSGAELDLFLPTVGRRLGVEFERQDAPKITRSMRVAWEDLQLDELWIVYLIHDRAPCFSNAFRAILMNSEVKTIRLPRRSPNLNAFAERWVRTAKELCFDQMIFLGESSLHRALAEMETFYNRERPHQGLENRIIQPDFEEPTTQGTIRCRSRLGRTLNFYYREAA